MMNHSETLGKRFSLWVLRQSMNIYTTSCHFPESICSFQFQKLTFKFRKFSLSQISQILSTYLDFYLLMFSLFHMKKVVLPTSLSLLSAKYFFSFLISFTINVITKTSNSLKLVRLSYYMLKNLPFLNSMFSDCSLLYKSDDEQIRLILLCSVSSLHLAHHSKLKICYE